MRIRHRVLPVSALLFAAVFPVWLFGNRTEAGPSGTARRMSTFSEVLALVEDQHYKQADPKKVIYSGIEGMLSTLDPHTNFLDDDAYQEMREEQRGSFFGLGIVINKPGRYQPLKVISPIAETPAARMGVRAGDVITHIRDRRADVDRQTYGLTSQEAVKLLRGPRGTSVEITIDRPGIDEPMVFEITRDAIRTPAVSQAFMLRDDVGYVDLKNFTETTSTELDESIEKLKKLGATRLVLDLRQNPGGLLDQAIGVASRFLEPQELIVYTEGRRSGSRQDYLALRDGRRVDWPLVVVVDGGSASASEIVAGALQDHDRAIVVGETTFGKGLVQSVYPLSHNTGLALTTQKYYSPIGRTIQRPYDKEENYFFNQPNGDEGEQELPSFRTDTGRVIYGGGGIVPDVEAKSQTLSAVVMNLLRTSAFARFVHPLNAMQKERYAENEAEQFKDFAAFVDREIDGVSQAEVEENQEMVALYLEAEIALGDGGMAARDRVITEHSDVIAAALDSLAQAQAILIDRRQLLARRGGRSERLR